MPLIFSNSSGDREADGYIIRHGETGGVSIAMCVDCTAGHHAPWRLARQAVRHALYRRLRDDKLTAAVEAAWA
jgi:hypothetical protein